VRRVQSDPQPDPLSKMQIKFLQISGLVTAVFVACGVSVFAYQSYRSHASPAEVSGTAVVEAPALLPAPPPPALAVPGPGPALATPAARPSSRTELAQALQTELKRTGCYDGTITGTWNAASRQAMTTFASNVNARLPVQEPDQILLALVQGHRKQVCATVCPDKDGAATGTCPQQAAAGDAATAKVQPVPMAATAGPRIEPPATPALDTAKTRGSAQVPAGPALVDPAPLAPPAPVAPAPVAQVPVESAAAQLAAAMSGVAPVRSTTGEPPPAQPAPPDFQPQGSPSVAGGDPKSRSVRHASIGPKGTGPRVKRPVKKIKSTTSISKSLNKSFKSIQRSLAAIFQ
jgi:hypothetical protein